MATATNLAFKGKLAAFVQKSEKNAELVVRKLALQLLAELIKKSPVDTGRFRGNWFVQDSLSPVQTIDTDKGGDKTIGAGLVELGRFRLGQTIYILNHLPYSIALEQGHSAQAPQGMVKITVAEFEQYLRKVGAEVPK